MSIWNDGGSGAGVGGPDSHALPTGRDACKYGGLPIAWDGDDSTGAGTGGPDGPPALPKETGYPDFTDNGIWHFNLRACADGAATDLWVLFRKDKNGRARTGGPNDDLLLAEAVRFNGAYYQVLNFSPKPKKELEGSETLVVPDAIYNELSPGYSGCGKVAGLPPIEPTAPCTCPGHVSDTPPGPLLDSYLVTGHFKITQWSGADCTGMQTVYAECDFSVVVTKTASCDWGNTMTCPPALGYGVILWLDPVACKWKVDVGFCPLTATKSTGSTPVGSYTDYTTQPCCDFGWGYELTNVVVS